VSIAALAKRVGMDQAVMAPFGVSGVYSILDACITLQSSPINSPHSPQIPYFLPHLDLHA
jgi:hypothetical protein